MKNKIFLLPLAALISSISSAASGNYYESNQIGCSYISNNPYSNNQYGIPNNGSDSFITSCDKNIHIAAKGGKFDEMHILVIDEDGIVTGTPNSVLEKYLFVSKAKDASTLDGSLVYFHSAIAERSKYVFPGYSSGIDWFQINPRNSALTMSEAPASAKKKRVT